ncbi:putative thioesterase involved in non-ribosomal peptide biosynthesis [Mycolicibacterium rhodesiae NBB3]|jgi:surfactin synthase thioesterase subunit|uniref:Thioesterase TesA n=1 Tax=Mycolicibacterium rhodesiae (strain NBB3) TaxID=710685 RepID=G8RKP2_MYCRN|nr:alpha/beta fold hydrolase [Mycolicibacterium rhodesiae]AEV74833.1 putative thioesterase involved in non-ribosomal peptide biosynthesis [Mycolicibacterium rhodesiae NBB3]
MRKFHNRESSDRPTLLLFPHAGAGASWYRQFSKVLSDDFEVIAFQYPGRQDRAGEPPLATLEDIAAGAFAEFVASEANNGSPITTLGHSMGALVSFEFARLAEAAGVKVRQLTVLAAVAPHRVAGKPPAPKDDQGLLAHLRWLGGTNADVIADPELVTMTFPVVKADHRAAQTYSCEPSARIAARIQVIGGDQDPIVSMADLHGWREHSDDVDVMIFEGGHFFLLDHVAAIRELL